MDQLLEIATGGVSLKCKVSSAANIDSLTEPGSQTRAANTYGRQVLCRQTCGRRCTMPRQQPWWSCGPFQEINRECSVYSNITSPAYITLLHVASKQ